MQVNSVNNSTTSATTKTTGGSGLADYNAFLQLLVTQLQHQDPTKPMDPTETVTQLATFASVEQSVQGNQLLTSLLESSRLDQASNAIGKTVTSADGSINGVIKSMSITNSGLVATLTNGSKVTIGSGVTIS
ncbi:flagellar hook assembly protein FlgD [Methylocystis sp. Sn-Cys]|uniref:flagellar hook assembly protein FlgD n=1 Tax=Methylocystis sp. Sn-Cys TaxID=1701263 RepID=UPI001923A476|nr:flagellar hook assembly protein FlgD [Methylocystis sp. Sn-Cys]MBL1258652.1 flagellar hook assembly protein FlgD [Methylocystis sp. Sn-Cys]